MAIPAATQDQLLAAMALFDREIRDTQDWQDWESNRAHRYAILEGGRRYPVKKIISLAIGMPVSEFSGGQAPGDANAYVRARGFNPVDLHPRNPDWTRDELILALDMYLHHAGNPPNKQSEEIAQLSETLNRLATVQSLPRELTFRNPNGAYMKLMNFRRLDPAFRSVGKVGLARGAKAEEDIWKEFADDPERCHRVALAIRAFIGHNESHHAVRGVDDDLTEAEEGGVLLAQHLRRERNRKLVLSKKARVLAKQGKLACEVCGFDFRSAYGDHGNGFIECHHTKPLESLRPGDRTHVNDLSLLCSNCHRMIHRKRPWLLVEDLRRIAKGDRT